MYPRVMELVSFSLNELLLLNIVFPLSVACLSGSSWAEWGSWSGCSTTCQGGTRLRRRQCSNGNDCTGSNVEVQYCNSDIPCNGSESLYCS